MIKYLWVYVAGPLRGNWIKKKINIYKAKKISKLLWDNKLAAFCPHLNSGFYDNINTDEFVLKANIDLLRRMDAILVLDGWTESEGTKNEVLYAKSIGMTVFYENDINELIQYFWMSIC